MSSTLDVNILLYASDESSRFHEPALALVGEGERFCEAYRATTSARVVRGNLVLDAHLVALMRENGIDMLWSHDRDFKTFEGVTVRRPFTGL